MYLLLTNDDGVDAPGLLALAQAVKRIAPIEIVAPERNWSASGHVKTMSKPLRVKPFTLRDGTMAHACDGAPSDCVAMVLLGLLTERPALVVSGINPHANVGHDLTYSGTVTAALEGAIGGVPSLAVSIDDAVSNDPDEYAVAAEVAAKLAGKILQDGMMEGTCLNLNVPAHATQVRGIQITRTGKRIYRDQLIERRDPRGSPYYWIGGEPPTGITDEVGTDLWALANGYISITPIHLDMTNHTLVSQMKHWASELEV